MPLKTNAIQLLGVRVDQADWSAIEEYCEKALSGDRAIQIVTINGEFILNAQNNNELKSAINTANLVIADSTNIVWVARLKGEKLYQTPGSELALRLAKIAAEKGNSVYLLGGRGDVTKKAAEKLQQLNSSLNIVGIDTSDPENKDICENIQKSGAAIVFVAYGGSAKQELWIANNKEKTGAKILVGVGGTFDMLAGVLPRAPKLFQTLHLEWLWRLLLQPSRWKRIWRAVVVFPLKAIASK
jgi:N-acetylglucosaminyldiphosphoundecaprenol N-acetyl-beta-D-mannosaminyltransferase